MLWRKADKVKFFLQKKAFCLTFSGMCQGTDKIDGNLARIIRRRGELMRLQR